jgi:hypothetical protein
MLDDWCEDVIEPEETEHQIRMRPRKTSLRIFTYDPVAQSNQYHIPHKFEMSDISGLASSVKP